MCPFGTSECYVSLDNIVHILIGSNLIEHWDRLIGHPTVSCERFRCESGPENNRIGKWVTRRNSQCERIALETPLGLTSRLRAVAECNAGSSKRGCPAECAEEAASFRSSFVQVRHGSIHQAGCWL